MKLYQIMRIATLKNGDCRAQPAAAGVDNSSLPSVNHWFDSQRMYGDSITKLLCEQKWRPEVLEPPFLNDDERDVFWTVFELQFEEVGPTSTWQVMPPLKKTHDQGQRIVALEGIIQAAITALEHGCAKVALVNLQTVLKGEVK